MFHFRGKKSSFFHSLSISTLLSLETVGKQSLSLLKSSPASRIILSSPNLFNNFIKWLTDMSWNFIILRTYKFGTKKYYLLINYTMEATKISKIWPRKNPSKEMQWLIKHWLRKMNNLKSPIIIRLTISKAFWTNPLKKKTKKRLSQIFPKSTSNMVQVFVQKLPTTFTFFMKIKCEKPIKLLMSTEILMELLKLMDFRNTKMKKKYWNTCKIIWKEKLKMEFLSERRKVIFMLTQI